MRSAAAPILAFDIETVPDVAALRMLRGFPDSISDAEVVDTTQRLLRQERNDDFMPLHLHRVATISCVLRQQQEPAIQIFSLPEGAKRHDDETAAIDMFFRIIDKYQPTLVSWNGSGFDLPVLHYRGMACGVTASTYWQTDEPFRWNNYTNRYHERHTDLMDVLTSYQPRGRAPLDDFAQLCGLPGKIGVGGGGVWQAWQAGEFDAIRHYCEADALLTYLLFIRFQHFRARLGAFANEYATVRRFLQQQEGEHWRKFLAAWRDDADADAPPPKTLV